MARRYGRTVVAVLALLGTTVPGMASPIPSKVESAPTTAPSRTDRATIEAFLARAEVARALAAQGLSQEQVEARVAQLSREDLSTLAANLDQIQAAGAVPNYIWILLAVLMGVTILATVF